MSPIIKKPVAVVVSVFIVYHILTIALMPNAGSFIGRQLGFVFADYAKTMGLAFNWALFAPDPADTIYMEIDLTMKDGSEERIYLPEAGPGVDLNPGKRRYLYFVRQMMFEPHKVELVLGPWLCRRDSNLKTARIKHRADRIPLLDAALASQSIEPSRIPMPYKTYYFNCEEQGVDSTFFE